MVPNLNAIQSNIIEKDLEDTIDNRLNLIQKKIIDFNSVDLITPILIKILLIIYIIGYFVFLPFAWFLKVSANPYGNPSLFELFISTILGSFAWPIIVIASIRAYIEVLLNSQRI